MIGRMENYQPYRDYGQGYQTVGRNDAYRTERADNRKPALEAEQAGNDDTEVKPGRRSSPAECQTCKERKYQDGSDENVSFKSPTHISPNAAAGAVRAHESEHVANAYSKAAENDGKVIRASVSIHTAVCPECGTTYVSGGTTHTMIKYQNEDNPYTKNQKGLDGSALVGRRIDAGV